MTLLHTLLHATNFSRPFLSTLVPSIGLAYTIQGLVAVPSILAQTERFYDLSGSITYISCTALSLYLPTIRARFAAAAAGSAKPAWPSILAALAGNGGGFNWRQVALSAAVSVWATRCEFCLGLFVFSSLLVCQWHDVLASDNLRCVRALQHSASDAIRNFAEPLLNFLTNSGLLPFLPNLI